MSSKASKKKISLVDNTILFSLISIVLGLLVGAIALLIAGKDPIPVSYTHLRKNMYKMWKMCKILSGKCSFRKL